MLYSAAGKPLAVSTDLKITDWANYASGDGYLDIYYLMEYKRKGAVYTADPAEPTTRIAGSTYLHSLCFWQRQWFTSGELKASIHKMYVAKIIQPAYMNGVKVFIPYSGAKDQIDEGEHTLTYATGSLKLDSGTATAVSAGNFYYLDDGGGKYALIFVWETPSGSNSDTFTVSELSGV